jgi:hypothetical protein
MRIPVTWRAWLTVSGTLFGLIGCGEDQDVANEAEIYYYLPRSALEATATFEFVDCKKTQTTVQLELLTSASVTVTSKRDPAAKVIIPIANLRRFWSSNTISVTTEPSP